MANAEDFQKGGKMCHNFFGWEISPKAQFFPIFWALNLHFSGQKTFLAKNRLLLGVSYFYCFFIEAKNLINIQPKNNHFLNFQLQYYNFSAKILEVWPPKKPYFWQKMFFDLQNADLRPKKLGKIELLGIISKISHPKKLRHIFPPF